MTTTTRTEPPNHNTTTCYTDYRCRRPDCVERYNARNLERIRAQKAGTWNNLIDAEPVRQHILRLQAAGIGPGIIANSSGVAVQSVLDFITSSRGKGRGRKQRTTPDMAARILAITVENTRPGRIDATGTVRRIQALVAIGWPVRAIALHAGLHPVHTNALQQSAQIYASTAERIEAAYNDLRNSRPERHGIDKRQTKRARNRAAANRWPTPKYWDQYPDAIDDPHFTPEYKVTRGEILAAEGRWLINTGGLTHDAAAERLGISREHLYQTLRRHPDRDSYGEAA